MPEMPKKSGVTRLVSEISCVVDHAKLPNLVTVAVVGFIYVWRKMKAFRPLEGRRYDEIQFEWIHLVNYYSRKPSFTLKILPNPFLRTADGYDGHSFRRRGTDKSTYLLTSNVLNFFIFGQ